ncbi:unnamed protein product (macronuclear) [Paramecium tetraurelia]|uniref:Uncharacterized protein n=1 Tax=Paramecium tetraurelia TaxID=5888 RepID=A0DBW4_PARTE|nr:uncharacterized protein GSPATT00015408001 [Paramecium tetraurelia]CAK80531.1 unnamed protein product [Paramecium tetraurelia]|eukprot:XP_001447928.1 hypothetical protein (macronuclear) [Paramecium tetraurelia strain d4-2]
MYNSKSLYQQVSPSSGRIQKISEKLSTIQIGVENERFQKLEQAEQRIQQAEDEFNEFQEQIFTKLNGLRDQLGKLQKQVEEDKLAKEQANETKNREVSALEKKFQNSIETEAQSRKEGESKVLQLKFQKETASRVDAIEGIHQGLQNDLPKIQEAIRNEATERDESDQNVMKSITDELVKLSNLINVEKRNRDESEQSIFEIESGIGSRKEDEGVIGRASFKSIRRYLQQIKYCSKSMIDYINILQLNYSSMSKEVRSISAHDPMIKNAKFQTQRNYLNVSKFWPENDYHDKETLYFQLKTLKEEINIMRTENIKLKTRILQQDKELQNFNKYFEDQQFKQNPLSKSHEYIIQQIKKQNKDLQQLLQEKLYIIEQMKKNIKVTKVQEISIQNQLYKEEINKLKKMLLDQENNNKEFLNQQTMIKENFLKTQQGFIKQQNEINDLKQQQQNDQQKINQLQNEVTKLNQIKLNLEDKMKRMTTEQNKKSSTNSFRSNKLQATTEISCTQLKSKTQDELQYKLIIRGITHEQFTQMIQELKQQAFDLKKQIEKEDIEYILSQEPFSLGQDRIQEVIKSLSQSGNRLADTLLNQIGKYKTFVDYPDFKIQEAEKIIKQTLKQPEITQYLQTKQIQLWNKEDVIQMIKCLKINWSEPVLLFYILNIFEKSGQVLEFKNETIIDPFPQLIQKESSRIIEESEEDLFEQLSDKSETVIIQDTDQYIT